MDLQSQGGTDAQQMSLIELGSDHAVFDMYKLLPWKLFIRLVFPKCRLTLICVL